MTTFPPRSCGTIPSASSAAGASPPAKRPRCGRDRHAEPRLCDGSRRSLDHSLSEVACINCGQCIAACPVGALFEKDSTAAVWEALADPNKFVVFQPAPAVRVAIGEEFGLPIGTACVGKMVAAMRRLGANKVFDVDFGADLTIMEEGTELWAG